MSDEFLLELCKFGGFNSDVFCNFVESMEISKFGSESQVEYLRNSNYAVNDE